MFCICSEPTARHFCKNIRCSPGDIAYFSARVRSSEKFGGKLLFRLRWQNAAGDWFPDGGGGLDDRAIARQLAMANRFAFGRRSQGAALVTVLMGSEKNAATERIQFTAPSLEITHLATP